MKPKPLVSLNHFTVPVVRICRTPRMLGNRSPAVPYVPTTDGVLRELALTMGCALENQSLRGEVPERVVPRRGSRTTKQGPCERGAPVISLGTSHGRRIRFVRTDRTNGTRLVYRALQDNGRPVVTQPPRPEALGRYAARAGVVPPKRRGRQIGTCASPPSPSSSCSRCLPATGRAGSRP